MINPFKEVSEFCDLSIDEKVKLPIAIVGAGGAGMAAGIEARDADLIKAIERPRRDQQSHSQTLPYGLNPRVNICRIIAICPKQIPQQGDVITRTAINLRQIGGLSFILSKNGQLLKACPNLIRRVFRRAVQNYGIAPFLHLRLCRALSIWFASLLRQQAGPVDANIGHLIERRCGIGRLFGYGLFARLTIGRRGKAKRHCGKGAA